VVDEVVDEIGDLLHDEVVVDEVVDDEEVEVDDEVGKIYSF
jgi:hypothetical protein